MARSGRPAPRLHRLPQRLDYTLIPAPLDLSLPSIAEKSPLPAIIVTPSSPSATHNYSIAFLAPPPKPTLRTRLLSFTPFSSPVFPPSPTTSSTALPSTPSKSKSRPFSHSLSPNSILNTLNIRPRSFLILSLILFIMICHLITHNLASRRPHLEFSVASYDDGFKAEQLQFSPGPHGVGRHGGKVWWDSWVPDERDSVSGSIILDDETGAVPTNSEADREELNKVTDTDTNVHVHVGDDAVVMP